MKKIAIVEVSMLSLHSKAAFADIGGKTILARILERIRQCKELNEIVVATSIKSDDQFVEDFCVKNGWTCFRGASIDLVDRSYQAASYHSADVIAWVKPNCALVDPFWIEAVVNRIALTSGRVDYASNYYPAPTLPQGLEVSAMTLPTLRKIWATVREPVLRTDIDAAFQSVVNQFVVTSVHLNAHESNQDYSNLHWNVEHETDLELIRAIYSAYPDSRFSWLDVLEKLQTHTDRKNTNSRKLPQQAA